MASPPKPPSTSVPNSGAKPQPQPQQPTQDKPEVNVNLGSGDDKPKDQGAFARAATSFGNAYFNATFPLLAKLAAANSKGNTKGSADSSNSGGDLSRGISEVKYSVNRVAEQVGISNQLLNSVVAQQMDTNMLLRQILSKGGGSMGGMGGGLGGGNEKSMLESLADYIPNPLLRKAVQALINTPGEDEIKKRLEDPREEPGQRDVFGDKKADPNAESKWDRPVGDVLKEWWNGEKKPEAKTPPAQEKPVQEKPGTSLRVSPRSVEDIMRDSGGKLQSDEEILKKAYPKGVPGAKSPAMNYNGFESEDTPKTLDNYNYSLMDQQGAIQDKMKGDKPGTAMKGSGVPLPKDYVAPPAGSGNTQGDAVLKHADKYDEYVGNAPGTSRKALGGETDNTPTNSIPKASKTSSSVPSSALAKQINMKRESAMKSDDLIRSFAMRMGLGDLNKYEATMRGDIPIMINGMAVPRELYTDEQLKTIQDVQVMRVAMGGQADKGWEKDSVIKPKSQSMSNKPVADVNHDRFKGKTYDEIVDTLWDEYGDHMIAETDAKLIYKELNGATPAEETAGVKPKSPPTPAAGATKKSGWNSVQEEMDFLEAKDDKEFAEMEAKADKVKGSLGVTPLTESGQQSVSGTLQGGNVVSGAGSTTPTGGVTSKTASDAVQEAQSRLPEKEVSRQPPREILYKADIIKFTADKITFEQGGQAGKGAEGQPTPEGAPGGGGGGGGGAATPATPGGGQTTTAQSASPQYDAMGNVTAPGAATPGAAGTGVASTGSAGPSSAGAPGTGGAGGKEGATEGGMGKITTKSGKSVSVASSSASQFQGFINDLESAGYKINSLGGYANRANVNNPSKLSYHAKGMAIDINPAQNPNRSTKTDLPQQTNELAKKWGLGWGMNWKSVKDPMHFSTAASEGGGTPSPGASAGTPGSGAGGSAVTPGEGGASGAGGGGGGAPGGGGGGGSSGPSGAADSAGGPSGGAGGASSGASGGPTGGAGGGPQGGAMQQPQYDAMGNVTVPGGIGPSGGEKVDGSGVTPGDRGGEGRTPSELKPGSFDQQAPDVMAKLQKDFGLSKQQAAGIVGNLGHESAGLKAGIQEKNPLGGGRGGLGWAQWTGIRRTAFESYLKKTGQEATDPNANYGFLKKELETTHKSSLEAVRKQTSTQGAMMAFEQKYEAAGVKHYASRQQYADRAMKMADQSERQQMAQAEPSNKASLSDKEQGVLRAARPQMSEEDRLALSGGELNPKAEMSRGEGGDEPWRGLIQKTSFSSSFKDQGDDQKEQWKKLSKAEKMALLHIDKGDKSDAPKSMEDLKKDPRYEGLLKQYQTSTAGDKNFGNFGKVDPKLIEQSEGRINDYAAAFKEKDPAKRKEMMDAYYAQQKSAQEALSKGISEAEPTEPWSQEAADEAMSSMRPKKPAAMEPPAPSAGANLDAASRNDVVQERSSRHSVSETASYDSKTGNTTRSRSESREDFPSDKAGSVEPPDSRDRFKELYDL